MAAVTIRRNCGPQENKIWQCCRFFPIYLPWSDGTVCHDPHFLNVDTTIYVYVFFEGVWFSCTSNWFSRNMVNLGQGNHRCYRDSVLHDSWRFSKFEFLELLLWWKIYVLRLAYSFQKILSVLFSMHASWIVIHRIKYSKHKRHVSTIRTFK